MARLIKADGSPIEDVYPADGKKFTLDEMYKLLDVDMIEICACILPRYVLIVDENGKLHDNPIVNERATVLYAHQHFDLIVGNALACTRQEAGFAPYE